MWPLLSSSFKLLQCLNESIAEGHAYYLSELSMVFWSFLYFRFAGDPNSPEIFVMLYYK